MSNLEQLPEDILKEHLELAERLKDLEDNQLEDAKVEAYRNFFDKRKLSTIKRKIRRIESDIYGLRAKKKQLDHLTCDSIAAFTRRVWLFERCTKNKDNEPYDFKQISVSTVLDLYAENQIPVDVLRKIARSEPWRSMWSAGKKQSNLFG